MGSTLKREFELSGIGLHLGKNATVRVKPANPGEGRYFVRVDLPDAPQIPARIESLGQTTLSTELKAGKSQSKDSRTSFSFFGSLWCRQCSH